jgi:hypothetical protein
MGASSYPFEPIEAGLIEDIKKFDKHPWCGHSVLMNKTKQAWQNVDIEVALYIKP